jgi:hypothetical protein
MDSMSWLWQRSAVSVLLVCLSGYLRYRAPRRRVRSLDEQKQAIQEQMELAALKRQQSQAQAEGAIGLLRGALQTARAEAVPAQRTTRSVAHEESEDRADPATPLSWQPLAPARPGDRGSQGDQGDLGRQGNLTNQGSHNHASPRQASRSS